MRPKQLEGLALARQGDRRNAQRILGELRAAGEQDPETLGIYARTWMDDYNESGDRLALAKSRDLYAQAFASDRRDYYTGINAAAKSVFLGEEDEACRLADEVEAIVGKTRKDGDYWWTVTAAEVQLIKREYDAAADLYQAGVVMSPKEVGNHESTWKQARLLLEAQKAPPEARARLASAFAHIGESETPTTATG